MPCITLAEHFHPLRGHVAEGTRIVFADGRELIVTSTLLGWVLLDAEGRAQSARDLNAFQLAAAVQQIEHSHA